MISFIKSFFVKQELLPLWEELRNNAHTIGVLNCSSEDGFMGHQIWYNKGKEIFEKLSEFYTIGRLKGASSPKMKVTLHSDVLEALSNVVNRNVLDHQFEFFVNDNMCQFNYNINIPTYYVYIESASKHYDQKQINGFFSIFNLCKE